MNHFQRIKTEVQSRVHLIKTLSRRHTVNNRQTLFRVYNSLVTSKLLYGIELTSRSTNELIHALGPCYNTIYKSSSGLLPSSPTLSVFSEAGILPFDMVVTKTIAFKAIHFLELNAGNATPLIEIAKERLQNIAGVPLPTILQSKRPSDREWYKKSPKIDWSIKKKLKALDPPTKAQAFFNELYSLYSTYSTYYTDGSKAENGVGLGILGPQKQLYYRLPIACSIFSAEAAALCIAVEQATKSTDPAIIFTDSASVLKSLENGKSSHPWVQFIDNQNVRNLTFCWIPGHKGIKGNEHADSLALRGRTGRLWSKEIPAMDARKMILSSISHAWQQIWCNERLLFCRKIKDTTSRFRDRPHRKEQEILSRLRVGHTRITHPHYIDANVHHPPECEICDMRLDVEHLLLNCRQYDDIRERLQLPTSIRTMLCNDTEMENLVITFLKEIDMLDKV